MFTLFEQFKQLQVGIYLQAVESFSEFLLLHHGFYTVFNQETYFKKNILFPYYPAYNPTVLLMNIHMFFENFLVFLH